MKKRLGLWKHLLTVILMLTLFVTNALAVDISGTVSYAGSKTGRVYVTVQTNNGMLGTSISAPGLYTIRGVPTGNYSLNAFMDSLDVGDQVHSSPAGSTTASSSGSSVTGVNIVLAENSVLVPGAPTTVEAVPGDSSVLIGWDGARDTSGLEVADGYTVYWNTSSIVSSTNSLGSKYVKARMDSPAVIEGLSNNVSYYFVVVPTSAGADGAPSAVFGPLTVGAPAGGNTVAGTVNYIGPNTENGPLYVAIVTPQNEGMGNLYFTRITNPSASQSFSVSGIPNGTYAVYTIYDLNNDGLFAEGDVTNTDNAAPMVTLTGSGASGITIALAGDNSNSSVNTEHWKSAETTYNEWYQMSGRVSGQLKRPVTVTLTSVPPTSGISVPMDLARNYGEFSFFGRLVDNRPVIGESYQFTVRYQDDSIEVKTAQVNAVLDSFPSNPMISGTPVSTEPTFVWEAPTTTPPLNYNYELWVSGINDTLDLPSSQLSAVYTSVVPSSPLLLNSSYSWHIKVEDQMGNSAAVLSNFTPTVYSGSGSPPPATWVVYNTNPVMPSDMDWLKTEHAALSYGNYIKLNGTYYMAAGIGGAGSYWNPPAPPANPIDSLYRGDRFFQVDQTTGNPIFASGYEGNYQGTSDGSGLLINNISFTVNGAGALTGTVIDLTDNNRQYTITGSVDLATGALTAGFNLITSGDLISYTGTPTNGTWTRANSTMSGTYSTTQQQQQLLADLSGVAPGTPIEGFTTWPGGAGTTSMSIITVTLPNATVNYSYSQQIQVNGGTPPYVFSIVSGTLPNGISLDTATGVLSGIPTTVSSYAFTVQVNDSMISTASIPLNILVGSPNSTLSWGGVFHLTKADGTEWDVLDIGTTAIASSLGPMSASVTGPNGFTYSFTDADINPYLNGQLAFSKQLPANTLQAGVYTFNFNDGLGSVSTRVDTHANPLALPIVDSTTIQYQRKADGSYRISWAPVNDSKTYNYRVRIQTPSGVPVHLGTRSMAGYEDVPTGKLTDGTAYQIRVEVQEASTFDLMTNRSNSNYIAFTPAATDYDANRLLLSYSNAYNRFEANGTQVQSFGFGFVSSLDAAMVTAAVVTGPNGFSYTFSSADLLQPNGIDFTKNAAFSPVPVSGLYTFHITANGLDHVAYATLTPAVSYPVPDVTTYQVDDLNNGNIRFSWADVNHDGALYYRVFVSDTGTAQYFTSGRVNQTYVDMLKSNLGDLSTKKWRVEVFDSSSGITSRNRVNGPYTVAPLIVKAYDATGPVLSNYGITNIFLSNGTAATEIWMNVTDSGGTITELRVDGPNSFTRNLLTQGGRESATMYRMLETGVLVPGLYKFTIVDSVGKSVFRYNYLTAPHVLPVVDIKTVSVTTEPNGDIRFSWAPVASDIPLWYSLQVYSNADTYNSGNPDLLLNSLQPVSSAILSAAALSQPQLMFRIVANDGSNLFVYNNRSRSVMAGYQGPGVNYSSLADTDGDGYASNVDSNDNDATVYPFSATSSVDTQAPSIPAGLYAAAVSSNQVDLSWSTPFDNYGVDYYQVFRDSSQISSPVGASNTFWQDNSVAASATYNYTVAACDAANNCSAQSAPFQVTTPPLVSVGPVNITGTISYSGSKTGRVFVSIQTDNGTLGTSVAWPVGTTAVAYTIQGVPSNNLNNNLNAFMDIADKGTRSASSPAASLAGSSSVKNVTLTDPTAVTPAAPTLVEVKPGTASVFIMWQSNEDVNGVVDADSYDVFWSTSPQVLANITGSKPDVPVGMDSPLVINGLTDGSVLYFQVVAKRGTYQTASTVTGPITVGATTGLNTVSGTVTYNGSIPANTPLYVAVVATGTDKGMGSLYYTSIASASANQAFSISGIPDGNYQVYTILDLNKDSMFASGDATNTNGDQAPMITLSGNAGITGLNIPLTSKNAEVVITTDHGKDVTGTSSWFSVNGRVSGQSKRPVTVTLTGKPASSTLAIPMDLGVSKNNNNEFEFWGGGYSTPPTVGDVYTFSVTYSDNTSETVTGAVTGVSNNFPTNPYVISSTIPIFVWSAPSLLPTGNYEYSLWINGINNNKMWEAWSIPNSQLQIVYGSGTYSSATPLQTSSQYSWSISTRDQNGNRATVQGQNFTTPSVAATPDSVTPYIVSTAPANGSTGVSTNTQISVTFSESITGMPALTAALKNNLTGLFVSGIGSESADGLTLIFTPSVLLDPATTYSIQLSTVTDLAGNPLPPTTLTFTTAGVVTNYTVTFNSNGGSAVASQSIAFNSTATAPTEPTKTGSTFAGWYSDVALTAAFTFATPITANTTLYAKWTVNSYTVTFNSNGGSAVASQSIAFNSTATAPTAPTKTGSTFAGWYSDLALSTAFTFTTPITADTTLYAKWTVNGYTVTFNSNGGSAVASQSIAFNSTATAPTEPTKTGSTFAGWYSDVALSTAFTFATPITANTTLYAKWAVNSYTVTFISNGGSAVASQSIAFNSTATAPTATTKTGSTFAGWYSDVVLSTAFTFATPITANTTLYAKWAVNSYAVTFNSNGGSAVASQSIAFNSTATAPTAPTKTGSTFAGWYSDVALSAAFTFATPITTNTVLYAKWTVILPTGDINGDGKVDLADAHKLLEIAVGRVQATTADLKNADVAPLVNGKPSPDGVIGIGDVVVILRRIVGSVTW